MGLLFRDLRADEIECRVAQISENSDKSPKGLSLLLYKDARVDQNILDETPNVGPMNWQRDHKELKGNIYCGISIWDDAKKMWVTKWDCGKESNTESEKGEASDSFKRAGFNWGIGRELYTAPFIWIPADKTDIYRTPKGVLKCRDEFSVSDITIKDKKIVALKIVNKQGNVVYTFGMTKSKLMTDPKAEPITEPKKEDKPNYFDPIAMKFEPIEPILAELRRTGYGVPAVFKTYKIEKLSDMTDEQIKDFLERMAKVPTKEAS